MLPNSLCLLGSHLVLFHSCDIRRLHRKAPRSPCLLFFRRLGLFGQSPSLAPTCHLVSRWIDFILCLELLRELQTRDVKNQARGCLSSASSQVTSENKTRRLRRTFAFFSSLFAFGHLVLPKHIAHTKSASEWVGDGREEGRGREKESTHGGGKQRHMPPSELRLELYSWLCRKIVERFGASDAIIPSTPMLLGIELMFPAFLL